MSEDLVEVHCPCCGAALVVDPEAETVVSHQAAKSKDVPEDLSEAVHQLKAHESGRDQRFRKQVEAEKKHGQSLEKHFSGLLKKARTEGPVKPFPREIDLD